MSTNAVGFLGSAFLAVFASVVITMEHTQQQRVTPEVTLTLSAQPAIVSYTVQQEARPKVSDDLFYILYEIESKQGQLRYRPANKMKSCRYTLNACGHHQMTAVALKQIGCTSATCLENRDDQVESERMARKYLAWLDKHYHHESLVFKYMTYNQGGYGTQKAKATAYQGAVLPTRIRRNILNNMPTRARKLGDRALAQAYIARFTQQVERALATRSKT